MNEVPGMSKAAAREAPWRSITPRFDAGPGARASIGLLVVAPDMAVESDMARLLRLDGVGYFVARMPLAETIDQAALARLEGEMSHALERLLPWAELDVIAFASNTGAITLGPGRLTRLIQSLRPGVAVVNPIEAAVSGLRRLGCRRVAVLTPYRDDLNGLLKRYLSAQRIRLGARAGFKQAGNPQMNRIDPNQLYDVGLQLGQSDCDGLFISCTALRTAEVIQALEDRLDRPVVTSNQALAWAALRAARVYDKPTGYGRLFMLR